MGLEIWMNQVSNLVNRRSRRAQKRGKSMWPLSATKAEPIALRLLYCSVDLRREEFYLDCPFTTVSANSLRASEELLEEKSLLA